MMKSDKKNVEKFLDRYLPSASKEEMEADSARVLQQLRSDSASVRIADSDFCRPSRAWWQLMPVRAAAAIVFFALLLVPLLKVVVFPENVYAIVETVTGSVYEVSDGKQRVLKGGERIESGTPVRTTGDANAVLKLPGGSTIEMHPESELSLERTTDGMNIRLRDGSVNVTPAKEPAGNLYLQNRDGTIPVVVAMFQAAATPAPQIPESRPAFEVVSIRQGGGLATPGARGGAGVSVIDGCAALPPRIDPGRFAVSLVTAFNLVTWAYSSNVDFTRPMYNCMSVVKLGLISGGPGWIRAGQWDIEATLPPGSPRYTPDQLRRGEVPELQKMLQAMLENRFKLVLRRERKEVPGYALTAEKGPPPFKFPAPAYFKTLYPGGLDDPNFKAWWDSASDGANLGELGQIYAKNATIPEMLDELAAETGRPVVDRTGLTGRYNFLLAFTPLNATRPFSVPTIFKAIEEQTGMRLEETKVTVDVLVIERMEKPSEN